MKTKFLLVVMLLLLTKAEVGFSGKNIWDTIGDGIHGHPGSGCGNWDPTCKGTPANQAITTPAFLRSFNIHVKNKTGQPIIVNITWFVYVAGTCANVPNPNGSGGGETNCDPQQKNGQWVVQPGEQAFLVNNAYSRYATFSARSVDGRFSWQPQQVDMGARYGNFNYNFQ